MSTSWSNIVANCKCRIGIIARSFFLSRERWKAKYKQQIEALRTENQELQKRCEQAEAASRHFEGLLQEQIEQTEVLENQLEESLRSIQLPDDPPAPGQHYGASFMALCVNLARSVGLRKSVAAMQVFFRWLNVKQDLPTYQAIRGWMFRLGLNRLKHAARHDDWIWIVDHSNQIGTEKCLLILGVRQSKLPREGKPLRLKDMTVLGLFPSESCNRESVGEVYRKTAEAYGVPLAVLSDGAVELREPVESLKSKGKAAISIRDLKHFLANRLEHHLSRDEKHQEFLGKLAQSRSAIQQTELSHLTPPILRQKARFMNLEQNLRWANMTLWHLQHPKSKSREGITVKRIDEKLGWLNQYKKEIEKWTKYQTIMSIALTFINEQGLKKGNSLELLILLKPHLNRDTEAFIDEIIEFIDEHEKKLRYHQRLPMSSEIIESAFARFKALEQYHARSGLTHLVLAIPCLYKAATAKEIVSAFAKTKVRDTQAWLKEHMPVTHDARRQTAYREFRNAKSSGSTKKSATALPTAA